MRCVLVRDRFGVLGCGHWDCRPLSGQICGVIYGRQERLRIALNLLREMGEGVSVGPVLIGAARPVHVASQSVSVRGLLNLTALAAVDAAGSKT
ncbi:phosphate acyltransferase [Thalassococcus arenae]|uniref:phosphate acyltransferase n=1 Tax=Thalassococcus arenae TaxID=2851652 RepID=UPI0032B00C71